MKILIIGSGGREHTLAKVCSNSPLVDKVMVAPGNGGIAAHAQCVPVSADDMEGLLAFAKNNSTFVQGRKSCAWFCHETFYDIKGTK